jgi:glycine/D-amino acid oxidase-like deaminating enzyme
MNRRALLKLAAALAVAPPLSALGVQPPLRVVVAGAGIVGASIALQLARAGATVTVVDRSGPASHASRGTFAWINATWAKQPRHYHALAQEGVAGWGDLEDLLALPVRWGGSIEWFDSVERTERLAGQIDEQVAWGEPARMLSADEVARLEPKLRVEPGMRAAFSPNDGAVDPVLATERMLAAAEAEGALLRWPVALEGVELSAGRLTAVETSRGRIPADRLVLATGADEAAPEAFADIAVPQRSTPGVIAVTRPMPRILERVVAAPGVHMHQRADGRIVLGEQEGPPDDVAHGRRLGGRPNDFPLPELGRAHGERMLAVARAFVPEIEGAEVENAWIGWRPLPLDGHPVLGASPSRRDVYLAIMHSGVSLAPIVGRLAATELLTETPVDRLDVYRPDRVFEPVRRY